MNEQPIQDQAPIRRGPGRPRIQNGDNHTTYVHRPKVGIPVQYTVEEAAFQEAVAHDKVIANFKAAIERERAKQKELLYKRDRKVGELRTELAKAKNARTHLNARISRQEAHIERERVRPISQQPRKHISILNGNIEKRIKQIQAAFIREAIKKARIDLAKGLEASLNSPSP